MQQKITSFEMPALNPPIERVAGHTSVLHLASGTARGVATPFTDQSAYAALQANIADRLNVAFWTAVAGVINELVTFPAPDSCNFCPTWIRDGDGCYALQKVERL